MQPVQFSVTTTLCDASAVTLYVIVIVVGLAAVVVLAELLLPVLLVLLFPLLLLTVDEVLQAGAIITIKARVINRAFFILHSSYFVL